MDHHTGWERATIEHVSCGTIRLDFEGIGRMTQPEPARENPRATLLNGVRQLMSQQLAALGRCGIEAAGSEEDLLSRGERVGPEHRRLIHLTPDPHRLKSWPKGVPSSLATAGSRGRAGALRAWSSACCQPRVAVFDRASSCAPLLVSRTGTPSPAATAARR